MPVPANADDARLALALARVAEAVMIEAGRADARNDPIEAEDALGTGVTRADAGVGTNPARRRRRDRSGGEALRRQVD